MSSRHLIAYGLAALLCTACGTSGSSPEPVSRGGPLPTDSEQRAGDALNPTAAEEAGYLKVLDLELQDGDEQAGRPEVPAQVDLTHLAPPPSNQLRLGACGAFACGYGLGTSTSANSTRGVTQPVDQVSPAYAFKAALSLENFTDLPTRAGVKSTSVLTSLVGDGSKSLAAVPYPQTRDAVEAARQIQSIQLGNTGPEFVLGSWAMFPSAGQERLDDMKQRLAAGQVLAFDTDLYPGFSDHSGPGVFFSNAAIEPDSYHGMLIVGYDDLRTYQDEQGETRQGALRVMNSWGEDWGDHGYVWLAYDTFLRSPEVNVYQATPVQRTAPPLGPGGTLLTSNGGPAAQVTSVVQDSFRLQDSLVLNYRFDDAVRVTGVRLGETEQALDAVVRNGQFYWIRLDGNSYQAGPRLLTVNATARDGRALTYTGNVVVPPGSLPPAPRPAEEIGTNGQDPP